MSSRDPAMSEGLRRVLARLDPRVQEVANLTRLSAGATNRPGRSMLFAMQAPSR
jgi:hypothetical protein